MDVVDETLREWRSTAFAYGQTDCMLSIGHYLARTGHVDVTAQFAGCYDSAAAAQEQLERHGGIAGLMAMAGAAVKLDPPERGDVIEVRYDDGGAVCGIGGLCTGDGVALRLERGMVEIDMRFVRLGGTWTGSR